MSDPSDSVTEKERPAWTRRGAWAVRAGVLALVIAGCAGGSDEPGRTTLRVFAAASLAAPFTELAQDFEAAHPGTSVELSLGPSSALAGQVASGAPADVFAAASTDTMDAAVAAGAAQGPRPFASNSAQVALPKDNPARIDALADLEDPGVKVAVCQPQVPCGVVAAAVLARAGLEVDPVTEETDVRAVLTKVRLGEVDAGLVYATDVLAAGDDVTGLGVPPAVNTTTTYPIATLAAAEHPEEAAAFVELVLSRAGRAVLVAAGFGRP